MTNVPFLFDDAIHPLMDMHRTPADRQAGELLCLAEGINAVSNLLQKSERARQLYRGCKNEGDDPDELWFSPADTESLFYALHFLNKSLQDIVFAMTERSKSEVLS